MEMLSKGVYRRPFDFLLLMLSRFCRWTLDKVDTSDISLISKGLKISLFSFTFTNQQHQDLAHQYLNQCLDSWRPCCQHQPPLGCDYSKCHLIREKRRYHEIKPVLTTTQKTTASGLLIVLEWNSTCKVRKTRPVDESIFAHPLIRLFRMDDRRKKISNESLMVTSSQNLIALFGRDSLNW